MTKLPVLAIVCLAVTSALAQNNSDVNKKPTNPQPPLPQGGSGDGGRQFPAFNTAGTILPQPQPGYPGYQDDISGFGPYASPQLGFGGYYPQIQPQQPQGYPGQPQIVYYSGTGQPFLVNPGNPPGNFLIPQFPQQPNQPVDPNIFNSQPVYPPLTPQNPQIPQTPVFVGPGGAGFPKQPVIPPIDKDAEEIPKDIPMQGGAAAANVPKKQKPQKIELDDTEEDTTAKPAQPSGATPQSPQPGLLNPNLLNLRPGQRFFILNGQPLFSNYPNFGYQHPNLVPERFANPYLQRPQQFYPQQQPQRDHQQFKPIRSSLANIIIRNQPQVVRQHVVPAHLKGHNFPQQPDGLPITLHNQEVDKNLQSVLLAKDGLQSRYYEKTIPFDEHQIPLAQDQVQPVFDTNPVGNFDYYKYNDAAEESAIIIDAKYQEPNEVEGM